MYIDYPFSHHMVLQRNKDIMISGEAQGKVLTLSIHHHKYQSEIINGHFHICVHFDQAGGPYDMEIQSEYEKMILQDVFVGDVFLAAGQSNMELPLFQTYDEKNSNVQENIRVLYVPQYVYPFYHSFQDWEVYNKETASHYSALIASFVKYLDVDIPIGIILNYKGGTSASCWMGEKYLKKDPIIEQVYWKHYYEGLPSLDAQKQEAEDYYKKFNDYQDKLEKYKKEHMEMSLSEIKNIIGHTPWPPPKGIYDYGKPSCLYENMFLKTVHYPIKAILYYQGEEDSDRYQYYESLLGLLVDNWREDYQEEVPFFIVQLPEYNHSHFSEIRLAQREVCLKKNKTYLVVSLGTGDPTYIHPLSKDELGKRLAYSVEKYLYYKNTPVSPLIQDVYVNGNTVVIEFDQILCEKDIELVVDGDCVIGNIEQNKLFIPVSSYDYIAYACQDVPNIEIMNSEKIPTSPFVIR